MTPFTYKSCGVDIEATDSFLKTKFDISKFCSLFSLPPAATKIAMSCDGVGTKLLYTILLEKYDTIGIDLVAMVANDLITSLAKPSYFLDYIGMGRFDRNIVNDLLIGIQEGCRQAGMQLVGGETAEMPDLYKNEDYDLAGFGVGFVGKERTPKEIEEGDIIFGFPSSGLHSNGYSMVRKAIPYLAASKMPELLEPTRIYVDDILGLPQRDIKGIANITGGGFRNIQRILPEGLTYKLNYSWEVPEVFHKIKFYGKVETQEMYNTFNMGIGIAMVLDFSSYYRYRDLKAIGEVVRG